jgi:hypothetical protein
LALSVVGGQPALGKSGSVVLSGNVVRWGQYRNIYGIVAVESPVLAAGAETGQGLANRIKDYPTAGSASVLFYCQSPGQPFFNADGKTILPAAKQRLLADMETIYRFDMLPILVLFDPDPSCRLDSAEAYARAAVTLFNALNEDYWFLLCVTDRADAAGWGSGDRGIDAMQMCKAAAGAVHQRQGNQLVAAGGSSGEINARLADSKFPVNVVCGRVAQWSAGKGIPSSKPVIEIIDVAAAKKEMLAQVVDRIYKHSDYGVGVHLENTRAEDRDGARAAFLADLDAVVDDYQKKHFPSSQLTDKDRVPQDAAEAKDGFVSLFNGKDLTGWVQLTPPKNFTVKDGVIRLDKASGGWLRSWDRYGDFVFRGEYKIRKGGNSGFYIRTPPVGRNSRIGFEYQIRGQEGDAPTSLDSTGSLYDARAPDGNSFKQGEWNAVEITCVGEHVKIVLNGHVIHDIDYDDVDFLKNRTTRGYIGLQDHHDFVEFRNLRIKPLDK